MLLTPLLLGLAGRLHGLLRSVTNGEFTPYEFDSGPVSKLLSPQVVVAGYGRIGRNVVQGLVDAGVSFIVIEIDPKGIADLRHSGRPCIYGDASNAHVLSQAGVKGASAMVVTFPDPMVVINTAKAALTINPKLKIVARVHRTKEADLLRSMGVKELVSPEYEASLELLKRTLASSGWKKAEIKQTLPMVQKDQRFTQFGNGE